MQCAADAAFVRLRSLTSYLCISRNKFVMEQTPQICRTNLLLLHINLLSKQGPTRRLNTIGAVKWLLLP